MDKVDHRGRKNVCRLAVSHLKRKKIEVEKRMRWFKKLGEPIKKELEELLTPGEVDVDNNSDEDGFDEYSGECDASGETVAHIDPDQIPLPDDGEAS